jgi:hypothetical protein
MDGFKNNTKMKCFKEGGSVKYESRKEHKKEMSSDIKQDKKIVKKALAMHDKQEHPGEKTDLSKLKKGGRAKKELGSARKFIKPAASPSAAAKAKNTTAKYKTGGKVSNVYEAKKDSGDKDNIRKTKLIKPTKAAAPSAAKDAKNTTAKFCGGKSVGKMQAGGSVVNKLTGPAPAGPAAKAPSAASGKGQMSDYERNRMSNISKLDPAQQAEFAKQQAEATAKFNKKKGGKVKKYAEGGAVMSDEEKNWLGGADATDPFILARMRSALGPKKPAPVAAPVAAPVKPETSADLDPYGAARRETSADLDPYGAASKPVAAPVRRPPMRRPMVKPETSADLDPYGMTRKETSADLDPYGAASKPGAAPYINIPANNPGMKQFRTDAVSPMETMFNSLFKSRSQRNKKPVA